VTLFVRAPGESRKFPRGSSLDLHMHILVTPPNRRDRRSQRSSKKLEWLIAWCW